jgi:hypothetical protein
MYALLPLAVPNCSFCSSFGSSFKISCSCSGPNSFHRFRVRTASLITYVSHDFPLRMPPSLASQSSAHCPPHSVLGTYRRCEPHRRDRSCSCNGVPVAMLDPFCIAVRKDIDHLSYHHFSFPVAKELRGICSRLLHPLQRIQLNVWSPVSSCVANLYEAVCVRPRCRNSFLTYMTSLTFAEV